MIRKIMVPVRGDGKGDNVLRHAAVLAHGHNAHIELLHCRPRPEDLMPYGVAIPDFLRKQILQQSAEVQNIEEQGMRKEMEDLARALNLQASDRPADDRATVNFIEETGRQTEVIKRRGRLTDVIAVPKPDRDRNVGINTLKSALFHSGRPVLMCPPRDDAPPALGKVVAVAWNGSVESARAVVQARPILRHAERVVILSSGEDAGPGTTTDDAVEYLRLHGATAEVAQFQAKNNAGRAIMAAAADQGADLLVMGAYGDSHERETLFGGNTQVVVDTATMPVLFSH